ncbi:hypothetical protein FACS1894190_07480 [Spirochaetia bacterium]|nr:hypothetical protein FACS1894190_07480 [Spirochaetia bacterium]
MKEIFIMYAKYMQDKDRKIIKLLNGLSNDDREKDRGSYYKSLSGVFRHSSGGMAFFLELLKGPLAESSAAKKIASPNAKDIPEGVLSEAQWKTVCDIVEKSNQALIDFVSNISEAELATQAKWFSGDMVSLSFMLHALVLHQAHHQGQLSQILDELKIDNDFSGLEVKFLQK